MSTMVTKPGGATRRAWIAVALMPVGFILAMVVGEGLISMLGYESGQEEPVPIGPALLAGGTGILLFLVPCVAAVVLGRRAMAAGEPQGRGPAIVAAVLGALFVVTNLLGLVLGR